MARTRLCEVCKQPIEAERAEFVPDTRLCSEHAAAAEAYGGEFKLEARQERTSKQGSLKLNYGGIETSKRRNSEAVERLKEDQDA